MRPHYLDPATGAYLLQMLVAGVLGTFYWFRDFFAGLFGGSSSAPDAASEGEDEDPEVDPEANRQTVPGDPAP